MPVHQHQQQAEEKEKKKNSLKWKDVIPYPAPRTAKVKKFQQMFTLWSEDITRKIIIQKSKGCGMDGEKAAEVLFRCIILMSSLKKIVIFSRYLYKMGSIISCTKQLECCPKATAKDSAWHKEIFRWHKARPASPTSPTVPLLCSCCSVCLKRG